MSLGDRRDHRDIWGNKPTALSRHEVSSLFKGILSEDNEARMDQDPTYLPEDGVLFNKDIDYTVEQWRMGLLVPLDQDQVEDLKQKNVQATEDWIEATRSELAERGEELPPQFEQQAYESLEFKNRYLDNSAEFYRQRAATRSRMNTMRDDSGVEESKNSEKSKRRRR